MCRASLENSLSALHLKGEESIILQQLLITPHCLHVYLVKFQNLSSRYLCLFIEEGGFGMKFCLGQGSTT